MLVLDAQLGFEQQANMTMWTDVLLSTTKYTELLFFLSGSLQLHLYYTFKYADVYSISELLSIWEFDFQPV